MSFCQIRNASVAFRVRGNPPTLPSLPAFGGRLKVPLRGGPTLTFGDPEGEPHQYWLSVAGTTQQLIDAGELTETTLDPNVGQTYPNASVTRARVTLDGNPPIAFEHDFRGGLLTPPTKHGTVELLAETNAVDFSRVPLPADGSNTIAVVDRLSLAAYEVASGDARQSRGQIVASISERFSVLAAGSAASFLILPPWCRRLRVRGRQISGLGTLNFALLFAAATAASKGQTIVIDGASALGDSAWIDCSGSIGLQPVYTGTAALWNVHVECESYL